MVTSSAATTACTRPISSEVQMRGFWDVLEIVAWIVAGVGYLSAFIFLMMAFEELPLRRYPPAAQISLIMWVVGSASVSAAFSFKRRKRRAELSDWFVDPDHETPDVLYLRPFSKDRGLVRWLPMRFTGWEQRSFQEILFVPLTKKRLRVVSIIEPGGDVPSTESPRVKTSPAVWMQQVETVALRARMAVVLARNTTGIRDEIAMLQRRRLLQTTLIIVPPRFDDAAEGWKVVVSILGRTPVARKFCAVNSQTEDSPLSTDSVDGTLSDDEARAYVSWLLDNQIVGLTFKDYCVAWPGRYSKSRVSRSGPRELSKLIVRSAMILGVTEYEPV